MPRVPVDDLDPQRWRLGLLGTNSPFSAVPIPPNRLGAGASYLPLNADGHDNDVSALVGGPTINSHSLQCDDVTISPDNPVEGDIVSWDPWNISVAEQCFMGSDFDGSETLARVVDRLTAQTSAIAEWTFLTGLLPGGGIDFAGANMANRALRAIPGGIGGGNDLTTLAPGGLVTGPVRAFSLINRALAGALGGLRGVIHVTAQVLPFLAFYGLVVRNGFVLESTLSDHLVVAGNGYVDIAPDGAAATAGRTWFYATSMIRAQAGPIEDRVVRGLPGVAAETNAQVAVAIRPVIAEWDLNAHFAIEVGLPDVGPPIP